MNLIGRLQNQQGVEVYYLIGRHILLLFILIGRHILLSAFLIGRTSTQISDAEGVV